VNKIKLKILLLVSLTLMLLNNSWLKIMIKVEFIQGSISSITNTPITTLVLEYPRVVHDHLLTHRALSRNSSSTRAIPVSAAAQQIKDNPAEYIWTYNQAGMQGQEVTDENHLKAVNAYYKLALKANIKFAETLNRKSSEGGYNIHKQNAGRLIEAFQNIRVCVTATEWENFFHLRNAKDAQPEIREVAKAIFNSMEENKSSYMVLNEGEWHVPFVTRKVIPNKDSQSDGVMYYFHPETNEEISLEEARNLSASVCAQTSYRKEDTSKDKTDKVLDMLFKGDKLHASPLEHQATPIHNNSNMLGFIRTDGKYLAYFDTSSWPEGVTHIDRKHHYWSGNFKNWIQYRQLIPNHDPSKV
jgi:thymidylate synthase ThyX